MIDFEEIIVLRDEKNKQKARYAKHRKDAQKKRGSVYPSIRNVPTFQMTHCRNMAVT